ncbi:hypothetical protein F4859DRAFT_365600 [Xylaria cf. heliscus]|nr:hypothetical protein F4859DRAFT_365600 [Xylaria cf. heliscus]
MPPKRKDQVTIVSDSESDTVSLRRPKKTALLPAIMRNIEMLKSKREGSRKDIAAKFNAYAAEKEKEIRNYYASEAKKRSAELKGLLTRYTQALEQRASIEKSIEDIVLDSAHELEALNIFLKAAYTGRQQQSHAAAGLFSSIAPVPVKSTTSVNPTNPRATTIIQNQARADRGEEGCYRNKDHTNEGKENVLDRISW